MTANLRQATALENIASAVNGLKEDIKNIMEKQQQQQMQLLQQNELLFKMLLNKK